MTEISARANDYLTAWYSQKPTFALMGEFSAGKSTLLNLILGETVLPTKVTATRLPVIWMTYGDTPIAESLSHDGQLSRFDINDLSQEGDKGHLLIRLSLPSETLKRSDVFDTPGISDRRLAANALDFIKPFIDFVVWCSAANQAWRQTEKAFWQTMSSEVHDLSILALTRADMMTKAGDLGKVVKRCQNDTAGMFRLVQPIATVPALNALDADGDVVDAQAWSSSHAETLFGAIKDSLRIAKLNCALRKTVAVPADDFVAPETPESIAVDQAEDTTKTTEIEPAETAIGGGFQRSAQVDALLDKLRSIEVNKSSKGQFFNTLDHLLNGFEWDTKSSEEHRNVLERAMVFDRSGDVPPQLVIVQLVRELDDFANTTWCHLDKAN